jgi:hypothetical protein
LSVKNTPDAENYIIFFNIMHFHATMLAVFATRNSHFALAQKPDSNHKEPAFQASSPKTSMARSATPGPFFVRRIGSLFGPGRTAPFAIGIRSS